MWIDRSSVHAGQVCYTMSVLGKHATERMLGKCATL